MTLTKEDFIACAWEYQAENSRPSFMSVTHSLRQAAREKEVQGNSPQSTILQLLANVCSMRMIPSCMNEPYKALAIDYQNQCRSSNLDDITTEQLVFFADIVNEIPSIWLQSRVADILWILLVRKILTMLT